MSISTELFDPAAVRGLAQTYHFDYGVRPERNRYLANPDDVAVTAERIARRYCGKKGNGVTEIPFVVFTTAAAQFVYAMECYGFDWTDVSRLSTVMVANILSELSSDRTLPMKPRVINHVARMQKAGVHAQIVRMAEIVESVVKLADDLEAEPARALAEREEILCWLRDQDAVLSVLRSRLFGEAKFAGVVELVDNAMMKRIYPRIKRPRGSRRPEVVAMNVEPADVKRDWLDVDGYDRPRMVASLLTAAAG